WQPPRCLAFVLPAGEPDRVRLIDLGEAETIDPLIAGFRANVTAEADASAGKRLRSAVFDPLADAVAPCRRLFLSPDGGLNQLPFEALPLDNGRWLIDEYRISYLSAGREVFRFRTHPDRRPAEPVVAADPDFDLSGGLGVLAPISAGR